MKDKESKNNKIPWYVRYDDWLEKVVFGKPLKIILVLVFILTSAISYGFLKTRAQTSYNEFYDIEFKNYISTKLENISNIVIDEGVGIKIDQIPQTVLEYVIIWGEEGAKFSYLLDTEKIIYEYYLETGKKPTSSYSREEFKMDIQMSKDFKNINKTSSVEPPSMTEEQYQKEYPKRMIIDAFCNALMFMVVLIVASIPFLFFSIFPAYASDKWKEKMQRQQ